ncbi:Hypothetical Protein FCC1311_018302 [Hondaea fermentalgiana]|uniref:Uncharacterized protein n=1 Tax=Hondaea fermentalgiana TaxID=2315210 RepID=A0A2R5GBV9_9STRA|nr:Hypothetical Protein FCC1311_018302 [Hondaea fermentalgiana]|eukprot:GBG25611.1 Hypothetical Protein FCC1311_018302 [Hondaea fermentalgiana]
MEGEANPSSEMAVGVQLLRGTVSPSWPRIRMAHVCVVTLMLFIMILGSVVMPTINEVTLKPSERFPPLAKAISFYSNIPIKLGLVHVFLYGCELYNDPANAERHIGQRLTTLWLQFFENPRWGQHFHMQLETFLQVIDILSREVEGKLPKRSRYPDFVHAGLAIIVALMMITNLVTSSAYHTFYEQTIGAAAAIVKLLFDYYVEVEFINPAIGASYTKPKALAGGALCTAVFVWCGRHLLSASLPVYLALLVHPTTLATVCFVGAWLTNYLFSSLSSLQVNQEKEKVNVATCF